MAQAAVEGIITTTTTVITIEALPLLRLERRIRTLHLNVISVWTLLQNL